MLPSVQFYFDTYALVERLRGSPAYEPYGKVPIFTHATNILELAARIIRDFDETVARREIAALECNEIEATRDDLFVAAAFWVQHRGKNVSYVDALGYTLAQRHEMLFLTGDKAFKGTDGVEYVP